MDRSGLKKIIGTLVAALVIFLAAWGRDVSLRLQALEQDSFTRTDGLALELKIAEMRGDLKSIPGRQEIQRLEKRMTRQERLLERVLTLLENPTSRPSHK